MFCHVGTGKRDGRTNIVGCFMLGGVRSVSWAVFVSCCVSDLACSSEAVTEACNALELPANRQTLDSLRVESEFPFMMLDICMLCSPTFPWALFFCSCPPFVG